MSPGPLLLPGRNVVIGHVQQPALAVVFVAAYEIVFRVDGHVRRGHRNIFVTGNIGSRRIIDFVVGSLSNRKFRNIALSMIENGIHIGRKNRLIIVIHFHSRICPPQKSLRKIGAVKQFNFDFKVSFIRMQSESGHAAGPEHAFHLAAPHGYTSIGILFDAVIDRLESRWTVMLRPVKFQSTRNPGAGQSNQCRFDHLVVINKVPLFGFIECHLNATTQFRQYHDFQVLVLQKNGIPLFINLFIQYFFNHRMRINHAAASLVNPFFQKHRIFFRLSNSVRRNNHFFVPGASLFLFLHIGVGDRDIQIKIGHSFSVKPP